MGFRATAASAGRTFKKEGPLSLGAHGLRRHRRRGWPRRPDGRRLRPDPEAFHPDPRGAGDGRPAGVAVPDEVRVRLSKLHRHRRRRTRGAVRPPFTGERRGDSRGGGRGRPATGVRLQAHDPRGQRVRGAVNHPRDGDGVARAEAPRGARGSGVRVERRGVSRAGPPGVQRETGGRRRRWRQRPRDRARDRRGREEGDPRPSPRGVPGDGEERRGRDGEPDRGPLNAEVTSLEGDGKVERAVVYDNRTLKKTVLDVDSVIVNIGFEPKITPLPRWGVELEGDRLIRVKADMSTSVRGIYACGDMVSYPGKDKRIVTGCGEAVTAVMSVYKYLKQPYWA